MHHFTICLLFFLGVDAVILRSHHHISRRLHGHPQTPGALSESPHALDAVDPLTSSTSEPSERTQTGQVKRDVTDRDWARSTSVAPSSNEPGHDMDYLSDTGTSQAAQPAQPIPTTESSVEAVPASASSPADQIAATAPRHAGKKGHARNSHHKRVPKHAAHHKKFTKKSMRW